MRFWQRSFGLNEIGIIPLLVSLPFMFYPMLLPGDTQPWVFMAALVAFFTFRTDTFIRKKDIILIILALSCITVYFFRSESAFAISRNTYTYLAFTIFWVVCQREKGDYFPLAVKVTIVIWFAVGLYQYVATKLGYQISIPGRFLAGRMGPPSLTAEASYYGSISMLQLMYLLGEKKKNLFFILLSVSSVLLSGSLLSIILLAFPLMKLPLKLRVGVLFVLPLLLVIEYFFTSSGVTSRLVAIFSSGFSLDGVLNDASLNLRAGHIYFTMYENLIPSLFLYSPVSFMEQYNNFASESGMIINTGTDYILPAMGEMIYGAGIFGLLLFVLIMKSASETSTTTKDRLEKLAFIFVCMLNPITISNIFLIMYITRRSINQSNIIIKHHN